MQFAIIASFAALALAAPNSPPAYGATSANAPSVQPIGSGNSGSGNGNSGNGSGSGSGNLCPALWTPQCCQADVLGLLGLTCDAPSLGLTSQQAFVDDCAAGGSTAQCCILPVAGQAVICTDL